MPVGVHRAEGPAADRGEAAPPAQPTTVLVQSALAGELDNHLGYRARTDARRGAETLECGLFAATFLS